MRARLVSGLACVTLALATACSGGSVTGDPTTAEGSSARPQDNGLPKYGAPAVKNPLAVNSIKHAPCDALTSKQVKSFPGTLDRTEVFEDSPTSGADSCNWVFDGDRYGLGAVAGGLVLPSPTRHGLSMVYRAKQQGSTTTFRPLSVKGYPAVIYASGRTIGDGTCRLSIGVRNDIAYRIETTLDSDHPAYETPCKTAKKMARFVVGNLKEAQ